MPQFPTIKRVLETVMKDLQGQLRKEVRGQGHVLSGNLVDSITYEVKTTPEGYTAVMYAADYGIVVNMGVSAQHIPYSGRRGRGGTSLYIQGLISYFERRGLPSREAKGAAFATAAVHKRQGMPTRASFRFSRNGRRTGFVETVIGNNTEKLRAVLAAKIGLLLTVEFGKEFNFEPIKIRL